ncbi:MAG: helix-turn-helix domain-containing protein [Chloroflexi bacterium]|nr:helix-turn-helix domain-containing protein [Chloroflexota bacterium]
MESSRPSLTIRETAALLALSTRTIHRPIAEGKLKAYQVGGEKTIRIKREDVDALLKPVGAEGETPIGRRGRGISPTSTETS